VPWTEPFLKEIVRWLDLGRKRTREKDEGGQGERKKQAGGKEEGKEKKEGSTLKK
jgi:hypothetical protein